MAHFHSTHRRVLIVDRSADNREVLRTVLQRQGVEILEAEQGDVGLQLAHWHRPDVLVLDIDTVSQDQGTTMGDSWDRAARNENVAVVLLGTIRHGAPLPDADMVAKPYHYRPLIRKIEGLLKQSRGS